MALVLYGDVRYLEEWKNGRKEEWQNGRMEGWTNGWLAGWHDDAIKEAIVIGFVIIIMSLLLSLLC